MWPSGLSLPTANPVIFHPASVCVCACRVEGLVSEEHHRLQPKPGQWKGYHWGQRQGKRRGQRSARRGRSSSNQTEDDRRGPAAHLPEGHHPPSGSASPQADAAPLGHLPRTAAARQVWDQLQRPLQACAPPPDAFSPPSQVPGRLPPSDPGNPSPGPDPGPAVSWDVGVSGPDAHTDPRLASWEDWSFCWFPWQQENLEVLEVNLQLWFPPRSTGA